MAGTGPAWGAVTWVGPGADLQPLEALSRWPTVVPPPAYIDKSAAIKHIHIDDVDTRYQVVAVGASAVGPRRS